MATGTDGIATNDNIKAFYANYIFTSGEGSKCPTKSVINTGGSPMLQITNDKIASNQCVKYSDVTAGSGSKKMYLKVKETNSSISINSGKIYLKNPSGGTKTITSFGAVSNGDVLTQTFTAYLNTDWKDWLNCPVYIQVGHFTAERKVGAGFSKYNGYLDDDTSMGSGGPETDTKNKMYSPKSYNDPAKKGTIDHLVLDTYVEFLKYNSVKINGI